ncbi:hypothetical protein [Embleya sp. NPDC001921]
MTPEERAHAQALNEFEDMHGSPARWEPWERDEFAAYVPAREARLLALAPPPPRPAITTDTTTGETTR